MDLNVTTAVRGIASVLICVCVFVVSLNGGVRGGYDEKRPYFYHIYKQPQQHYYHAGFTHGHDGVSASYRNDERQQYVNSVAYTHGTGIGTAPWYGVPGTAFDFTKSGHSGGNEGYGGHGYGGGHGGGGHGGEGYGGSGHGGGGYGGGGYGGHGGGGYGYSDGYGGH